MKALIAQWWSDCGGTATMSCTLRSEMVSEVCRQQARESLQDKSAFAEAHDGSAVVTTGANARTRSWWIKTS
jgi:hypothetical protein